MNSLPTVSQVTVMLTDLFVFLITESSDYHPTDWAADRRRWTTGKFINADLHWTFAIFDLLWPFLPLGVNYIYLNDKELLIFRTRFVSDIIICYRLSCNKMRTASSLRYKSLNRKWYRRSCWNNVTGDNSRCVMHQNILSLTELVQLAPVYCSTTPLQWELYVMSYAFWYISANSRQGKILWK